MHGYRQSLGRITEGSESSAAEPHSHARKTPSNGIESRPAVCFPDQLDSENSNPGEKLPRAGHQTADNRAGVWTRRRLNLAYVGFVPFLHIDRAKLISNLSQNIHHLLSHESSATDQQSSHRPYHEHFWETSSDSDEWDCC